MAKFLWLLVLCGGLFFSVVYFGKSDIPAEVEFRLIDGGTIEGVLIGKDDDRLVVEDKATKIRTSVDPEGLGFPDRWLLWRYPTAGPPPLQFPVNREIANQEGSTFEALVTGKQGNTLVLVRTADKQRFFVDISTLSGDDREFFAQFPDENAMELREANAEIARKQKLKGRYATWHRSFRNAVSEAEKYDLPIMLVFQSSVSEMSKEFETVILSAPEFRNWANENVVLCLYYNDPNYFGKEKGLEGLSAKEGRELAREYSTASRSAVSVILRPGGQYVGTISEYKRESVSVYLDRLEVVLDRMSD